jgi:Mrp family chromosome partitioning ATPase
MTHQTLIPIEHFSRNHFCNEPEGPPEPTIFSTLAHAIFDKVQAGAGGIMMFTSCHAGAGVSFIATAVGVELARTAGKVLIADAEAISKLAHCGTDRVAYSLRCLTPGRVWVLDRELVERCSSPEFSGTPIGLTSVLATMRVLFPYVLIDAPAISATTHVLSLCGAVDGTVLIVGERQPDIRSVAEAHDRITTLGGRVIGSILNSYSYPGTSGYPHAQIS